MSDIITGIDLSGIKSGIDSLEQKVSSVDSNVQNVAKQVSANQKELEQLRSDFIRLMNEQKKDGQLQQATSELISVRQEIEKNFGNYRNVRNNMIGILQATDAALVRKTTISNISEELMMSTPNYWLAPVLVAIAAWINNDRDLADRAIREAVKRDNEHTSLVMALVCRRNNRTQTCYEWLSRYFATQKASSFDEDGMVYIDAYINGVFGVDEKHMCDDYITRWLNDVRGVNSDIENEQSETWKEYFKSFNIQQNEKYPELMNSVKEYHYIEQYLERVDASESISSKLESIMGAPVNTDELRESVDEHLIKLVQSDAKEETALRAKEDYLCAVKACGGDVQAAQIIVNKKREEQQSKTMDIISQMTGVISGSSNAPSSQKKTAVSFLHGYISKGYGRYIDEHKAEFPNNITISVNGFECQTSDGSNREAAKQAYDAYLTNKYNDEMDKVTRDNNPKIWLYSAAALGVIGLILCFTSVMQLGVIGLIAAGGMLIYSTQVKKNLAKANAELDEKYQSLSTEGKDTIDKCMDEWNIASGRARTFNPAETIKVIA